MMKLKGAQVSTSDESRQVATTPNLHLSHMRSVVVQVSNGLLAHDNDVTLAYRHGRTDSVSIWMLEQDGKTEVGPVIGATILRLSWSPLRGLHYHMPAEQDVLCQVPTVLAVELAGLAASLWAEVNGD